MKPYNPIDPKSQQVREMFDTIAPHYDRLNHLLSFGVDRWWRRRLVKTLRRDFAAPKANPAHHASRSALRKGQNRTVNVLDLATGTGDLAIAIAKRVENSQIVGADSSEGMLRIAQEKIEEKGFVDRISLSVAEAEKMPFDGEQFDAIVIGFGVRNFQDMEVSLNEMLRVLKRGGRLYILEFSIPTNRVLAAGYRLYFHNILPMVGSWISKDKEAYRYLPNSVEDFFTPELFRELLAEKGFVRCRSRSLTFGIARIYTAEKIFCND